MRSLRLGMVAMLLLGSAGCALLDGVAVDSRSFNEICDSVEKSHNNWLSCRQQPTRPFDRERCMRDLDCLHGDEGCSSEWLDYVDCVDRDNSCESISGPPIDAANTQIFCGDDYAGLLDCLNNGQASQTVCHGAALPQPPY